MSLFKREQLYTEKNKRLSVGLFKETCTNNATNVVCTIMSFDPRLPRLIDLYVEYCVNDPSEYDFAIAVFGNWEFWTNITSKHWFKEYHKLLQEEAETKRKSLAFKTIINEASKEGPTAVNAAKFLIQEPWKEQTRASKAQAAKTTEKAKDEFADDYKRLQEQGFLPETKH